jgi:small subunit ribosomal protein S13
MLYFLQTPIPENDNLKQGLQSIYGVGIYSSKLSLKIYGLLENVKGKDLRRLQRLQIKSSFENYPRPLGKDLKQINLTYCKRLVENYCYKGRRHNAGYPVRGQRTHTNAKTQKALYKRWEINTYQTSTITQSLKKEKSKPLKKEKSKSLKKKITKK